MLACVGDILGWLFVRVPNVRVACCSTIFLYTSLMLKNYDLEQQVS